MKISPRSLDWVLAGTLFFGLLAVTARPATDPDLWWHLRTGQWIAETGHIPHSDPFSFSRAGSPWISHEWLSEVAFYTIWRHASWAGLIVFSSIVTTVGFMLLYLRCPGRRHWAAAATALGALASAPAWGVRPQMFSFLMTSLLFWLIERGQDRPKLLLWIPPLFLLWLNLHAGFALGPALLAAYCAGLVWEAVSGESAWDGVRPQFLRLMAVLLACMAVVPVNPSGVQLYRYPLDVLRSAGMRSFITEWASPDFHEFRYVPFLVLCLALTVAFARSETRPKARWFIPLLGTLFAALDAARHIPIFVLVAVPLLAGAFPRSAERWELARRRGPRAAWFRIVVHPTVVALTGTFALAQWVYLIRTQTRAEAELFPKTAVEFLASHPAPDRLFAYYDWGGYAIWKLYPGYRVFVDGRADLYGDDLLEQFKTAIQLRPAWREVLERWDIRVVLVPPSSPLAQALALETTWQAEYRDKQAVLYQRTEIAEGAKRQEPPNALPSRAKK